MVKLTIKEIKNQLLKETAFCKKEYKIEVMDDCILVAMDYKEFIFKPKATMQRTFNGIQKFLDNNVTF